VKIGKKIIKVKSCPSTNDTAKKMAVEEAEEGTVVLSEEQTRGKGTKGREWFSVRKKGIYASIILRPPKPDISLLPLIAALAVRDAVFECLGISINLRWPNDLVWEEKKLGGILCESNFLGSVINYVIVGIGLDVAHRRKDFPDEIVSKSTSLSIITQRPIEISSLLGKLWQHLDRWYKLFLQDKEEEILKYFQKYSVFLLGQNLAIETAEGHIFGIYRGIDSRGRLCLEISGDKRLFFASQIMDIKESKEDGHAFSD